MILSAIGQGAIVGSISTLIAFLLVVLASYFEYRRIDVYGAVAGAVIITTGGAFIGAGLGVLMLYW